MYKFKGAVIALCLLMNSTIQASINSDLNTYWEGLGYQHNITSAKAWQDQQAGYYSGGSVVARTPSRNFQALHVELPDISSGCSGIDMHLGSLSYIKGDEIVKLGKSIMANGAGYAFDLALESTIPEIKHVKDRLEATVQKINQMNINSCEAAQNIVGGMFSKLKASQTQVCKETGTSKAMFSDWASARQSCASVGKFDAALDAAAKDNNRKNDVIINKNLIWEAIQNTNGLSSDKELSELVMSLTGTVIFDKKGNANIIAPMQNSNALIQALLYGQTTKLWQCDNQACLKPSQKDVSINANAALVHRVETMIVDIINKTHGDRPLTQEQIGFLNATPMPVVKFVTVMGSLKIAGGGINLTQYSELIAQDLLQQYLASLLKGISTSVTATNYPMEIENQMEAHVRDAQIAISKLDAHTSQKLATTLELVKNMQVLEQSLASNMTNQMDIGV